jgi:hypothetical protein
MPPEPPYDLVVVGSGPSGTMAALEGVRAGARVLLLDFGNDDELHRDRIPDIPFSRIRSTDAEQHAYLIGRRLEGVPSGAIAVGAQLTPPRQFVSAGAEAILPIDSESFSPMQSLSLGGLGAAWGAACFTYTADELVRIGLDPAGFDRLYEELAEEIGISAPEPNGDEAPWWTGLEAQQPCLRVDSNAESILRSYAHGKTAAQRRGFFVGRIPLAVLSKDKGDRKANPYFDMDFYGESRRSVFRPRYVVEKLRSSPFFSHRTGRLVVGFEEVSGGARVFCRFGGAAEVFEGRRLMLCAGAINTGRLALNSVQGASLKTPLLCNGYTYMPMVNLRMFGREAMDARYSLAQLHVWLQDGPGASDNCSVQLYSYRSLLLFKLVKEMPFPPWLGLQVARTLVNSLAICGVFTSDEQSDRKTMRLAAPARDRAPRLEIGYARDAAEEQRRRRLHDRLAAEMRRIGCVTLKRIDPGHASSIHYAGTVPFRSPLSREVSTEADHRLAGHRFTYIGDSSSWNWLPSKGLTFTLMASARRIARQVLRNL